MVKTLFKRRNLTNIFLIVFFFSVYTTLTKSAIFSRASLEIAFMRARDCYHIDESTDLMSSFSNLDSIMHILCLVPIICKIFVEDLDIAKSYLFVRMKSTSIWFAFKTFQCAMHCLFASFMYNSLIIITALIKGCRVENPLIALRNFLIGVFAGFLILFICSFIGNVLSLKFSQHISVLIVLILIIFIMLLAYIVGPENVQYLFLMLYHFSWFIKDSENFSEFISYPAWYYYTALTAMAVVLPLIGNRILKKSDQL